MRRNTIRALALLLILALLTGCGAVSVTPSVPYSPGGEDNIPSVTPPDDDPGQTDPEPDTPPAPPEPTVSTLAVCGDVMTHMPVLDAAKQPDGSYDFSGIMAAAKPYVSGADFAVANLETTLAESDYSGYPKFKAPDKLASDLKDLGFDLLLTANNHCMDVRYPGLERTLDVLDGLGIPHVGTSRSQEERDSNAVVGDVGGISVAFLGYTYGTNGIPLPSDKPFAVNLFNTDYLSDMKNLDTETLLRDLDAAKALDADLICVMIHWGVEYKIKENTYQNTVADFLIENGVDIVLGGHSHVPQPIEMRTVACADGSERTGFVCYSLGNFISNQNHDRVNPYTDVTAVLTLELTKDNVTGETSVTDWQYAPMFMMNLSGQKLRLMDCYQAPDEAWIQSKLDDAIESCHKIFGAEHDHMLPEQLPEAA